MASPGILIQVAGRDVRVSNPDKVYFPSTNGGRGITKLELVGYYVAVAEVALRHLRGRPMLLKRYVQGIGEEPFYQKRAPDQRPDWIETATFRFPSGRSADEVVVNDAAQLAWVVNLGCVEMHVHPVRADDMDHPDELRVDLDPVSGVGWRQLVEVAGVTRAVLDDHGLIGWPKTSGSRGIHVWVRIERRWPFDEVRRAALALAREVERRAPAIATSRWWKEERRGVFLDYNQNARDRTTASAYSVRAVPDARVSMPLTWDDLGAADPADFTLHTVPALIDTRGDAHAGIDEARGSLDGLLELAARQERAGQGDAPWPPHHERRPGEPPRAPPSRRRRAQADNPLLVVGQAARRADVIAGLERWKARHPAAAALLRPEDVLVDTMRGRFSAWYRVRVNLKSVPPALRPAQEPLDPDFDPALQWGSPAGTWPERP